MLDLAVKKISSYISQLNRLLLCLDKMSEEERKRKRERNNESVKKCRQNEKLKISHASEELAKHKKEYTELEEKYKSLQKELQVLKSLFQAPAQNATSIVTSQLPADSSQFAVAMNTENMFQPQQQSILITHANQQDINSIEALNNTSLFSFFFRNFITNNIFLLNFQTF